MSRQSERAGAGVGAGDSGAPTAAGGADRGRRTGEGAVSALGWQSFRSPSDLVGRLKLGPKILIFVAGELPRFARFSLDGALYSVAGADRAEAQVMAQNRRRFEGRLNARVGRLPQAGVE